MRLNGQVMVYMLYRVSTKETKGYLYDDNNDDIHDRIDVEFQAPLSPSRGIFRCSVLCFAEVAQ